jgi:hypothetical protein
MAIGFALIAGLGDGSFSPPVHFPDVTGSILRRWLQSISTRGHHDVVAGDASFFCCDGATPHAITFIV